MRVTIVRKPLNPSVYPYEILQILSLTLLVRTMLDQLLARVPLSPDQLTDPNQLLVRITLGCYWVVISIFLTRKLWSS